MDTPIKTSNFVEHQLDPKLRVAVPTDWRPPEGIPLRLRYVDEDGIPMIRAYFEASYQRKLAEIEGHERFEKRPAERDKVRRFFKRSCHKVVINTQGKLTVPPALAKAAEFSIPGKICLEFSEDDSIDLYTPENHTRMTEMLNAELTEFSDLL